MSHLRTRSIGGLMVIALALCFASSGTADVPPGAPDVGAQDVPLQWDRSGGGIAFDRVTDDPFLPNLRMGIDWLGAGFVSYPARPGLADLLSPNFAVLAHVGLATITLGRPDGNGFPVTLPAAQYPRASWSPDSSQLAFETDTSAVGENPRIAIVNADGSGFRYLAAGYAPAWSPYGTQIAFAYRGLSVIDADGSNRQLLAEATPVGLPAWSPSGDRVAFATSTDLRVADASGRPADVLVLPVEAKGPPRWTPDGSHLLYDAIDGAHVVDLPTGSDRLLIAGAAHALISPDGQRIAYATVGPCDAAGIYLFTLDTRRSVRLTLDCRHWGTPHDDVIAARPGRDAVVYGRAGNDRLDASKNSHATLYGGPGNDTLIGGAGPDTLAGGPGQNTISAGRGDDTINAAAPGERDTIACGRGYDVVFATHEDTIAGDCEVVYRLPEAGRARLRITVWPDGTLGPFHSWTLKCAPTGGNLPDRARGCATLAHTADQLTSPPNCQGPAAEPAVAHITGTFHGRKVGITLSRQDGCWQVWDQLAGLLPLQR
jgi:hypothetical protein